MFYMMIMQWSKVDDKDVNDITERLAFQLFDSMFGTKMLEEVFFLNFGY